ncbi:hypothetical protein [Falsiporphyromonas endometrii]|uniref:Secreted protein n=1 Tax=Falsiporphyromonas endometrii TaxID=1387297 RepID=A0ABV9KA38_9PORP
MEISILLTILLISITLGGILLRRGEVCLIEMEQICALSNIKYNPKNTFCQGAVKFVMKEVYLLNIITAHDAPKGAQATPIYIDFHTYWG